MENLELLLSLIGTAVSFLIATVVFIVKFVRSIRTRKMIASESDLLDAVIPLIELAEKYKNYSGEEKKEFVLTKLNQFAIENKISFDSDAIVKRIEELIILSKNVNVNITKENENGK
ncbi:MAG: hypothetical protein K2K80_07015 [Clostridia bacterium]|nr:hypothetical protein [Clostridia bacterium]